MSSILLLHSLIALAQNDADGSDLGSDPGLPAEAPTPPVQPPAQAPAAPRHTKPAPSVAPTAPLPEPPVQPHEGAAPAQQGASKARQPITGKLAELNLTPEQEQQIVDARRKWKPDAEKRLKEEVLFLKQNLAQGMADNSGGEEVRRRFEMMQKKYLELQTMKFDKLLRIREILTLEQRKKFAELRSRSASKNNNNDTD
jgi:Spy/CpxP family protein refolding chaperone